MKTKEQPIDLDQELTLEYVPAFQSGTFVVTGDPENVLPLAEAVQAEEKAGAVKHASHVRKAGQTALETVTAPMQSGLGRVALDIKTVAYDKAFGTDFYEALRQKRADERNLRFATKIGLISITDTTCRKHQAAIAKMRGL